MTEEDLDKLDASARAVLAAGGRMLPDAASIVLALAPLARVGLAVHPRPIAEAPRDGTPIYAWNIHHLAYIGISHAHDDIWYDKAEMAAWKEASFSHFIPLSALPKPGGE